MRKMVVLFTLISWIVLIVYLAPFIWMIGTSFKPQAEWRKPYFAPNNPTLQNYKELTTGAIYGTRGHFPPITRYLINSIIVSTVVALLTTLLGSMLAYAIHRYKVGGLGFANWVLSLRMMPPIATLLPLSLMVKFFGLYNTLGGLIFVYPLITLPLTTWFMIGSFKSIPRETDEAALLDGCTELQVFYQIVLPQATSGLATAAIFAFLFSWSEFLIPVVLTANESAMPLTVFASYFATSYGRLWGPAAAAGTVIAIPVIIIGILIHKYILRGLTLGLVR